MRMSVACCMRESHHSRISFMLFSAMYSLQWILCNVHERPGNRRKAMTWLGRQVEVDDDVHKIHTDGVCRGGALRQIHT